VPARDTRGRREVDLPARLGRRPELHGGRTARAGPRPPSPACGPLTSSGGIDGQRAATPSHARPRSHTSSDVRGWLLPPGSVRLGRFRARADRPRVRRSAAERRQRVRSSAEIPPLGPPKTHRHDELRASVRRRRRDKLVPPSHASHAFGRPSPVVVARRRDAVVAATRADAGRGAAKVSGAMGGAFGSRRFEGTGVGAASRPSRRRRRDRTPRQHRSGNCRTWRAWG
jgi:hypothetical protein